MATKRQGHSQRRQAREPVHSFNQLVGWFIQRVSQLRRLRYSHLPCQQTPLRVSSLSSMNAHYVPGVSHAVRNCQACKCW